MTTTTKTITLIALAAILYVTLAASNALASTSRTLSYRGLTLAVPAGWKVFRLATEPQTCVRFNRHAIYLGTPGGRQACPATTVGRTEAILVQPQTKQGQAAATESAAASDGQITVFSERRLLVTATWSGDRKLIERLLHRTITATPRSPQAPLGRTAEAKPRARSAEATPHASAHQAAPYSGPAFDACSTPSLATINSWAASPYRGVGVYIGGVNIACGQTNLNANWVYGVSQAGWHVIPTYVGEQAPGSSCSSCSLITPSQATQEGAAAATDAIYQMQQLGLGAGNPVYYDMEAYNRTSSNTATVLAFLQAWTQTLHTAGYLSGVYSSGASGITDLVDQWGTTYTLPDDLWVADWNNSATATDPYVPAGEWAEGQLVHQYEGGHNATYGGVTINIDSDYADGATASGGSPTTVSATAPPVVLPSLTLAAAATGTVTATPAWTGTTPVASWRLLGGFSPTALAPIAQLSNVAALSTNSTFPYYAVEAFDSNGDDLGTSAPDVAPAHVVIFGHSAYTPVKGLGGLPAGCFTGASCHLSLTLKVGRTTVAQTGTEPLGSGSDGIVWFTLTPAGRRLLVSDGGHMGTQATLKDASGAKVTSTVNVNSFVTAGAAPKHTYSPGQSVKLVGGTGFVGRGGFGGVLAGCTGLAPCQLRTTITAGRQVIATTGTESIAANQLGYLFFSLTKTGVKLLLAAKGNLLAVHVAIVNQVPPLSAGYGIAASASANIALVHAP